MYYDHESFFDNVGFEENLKKQQEDLQRQQMLEQKVWKWWVNVFSLVLQRFIGE